jgi:hypothetical protein
LKRLPIIDHVTTEVSSSTLAEPQAQTRTDFRLVDSAREEHVTPGGNVQRFQFSRFVRSECA